jgi:hypothetical protein
MALVGNNRVSGDGVVKAEPIDELAVLRSQLHTLKQRGETHRAELETKWALHHEQDKFYHDAEARQAAMDAWSQRVIEETMERETQKIQQELRREGDEAAARLRLPPPLPDVLAIEAARRTEKVTRLRELETRRSTTGNLAITDRS